MKTNKGEVSVSVQGWKAVVLLLALIIGLGVLALIPVAIVAELLS